MISKQNSLLILLILLFKNTSFSQVDTLIGKVVDSKTEAAVINATIKIVNESDSTLIYYAVSQLDGTFQTSKIKFGRYRIEITSIGFEKRILRRSFEKSKVDFGSIKLEEKPVTVGELVVEGRNPVATQKGDTTEFNTNIFKTNKDATAEELVQKLPGLQVEGGAVKSGGEQVQRVLVNGRQFFGNDPMIAMRNLPAEVIDKIQVFDRQSEQSTLTGFDDGNTTKTMNIITRPDKRNMQFGKLAGAYGEFNLYNLNGSINQIEDDKQLSAIGMSNNVNQQNFSFQDLLGVMGGGSGGGNRGGIMIREFGGRGGVGGGNIRINTSGGGGQTMFFGPGGGGGNFNPGSYMTGQQSGLNTTHSLGLNYTDKFENGVELQSSYFGNFAKNNNPQNLNREYFLSADSSMFYNEGRTSKNENSNHRLNARVTFNADTMNTFIMTPSINFQNNSSNNSTDARNFNENNLTLNNLKLFEDAKTNGLNFSNNLIYRHKFEKQGRSISIDFGNNFSNRLRNSENYSETNYPSQILLNDTIDQNGENLTESSSFNSRIQFTEPINQFSILQFNYSPMVSKSIQENERKSINPITQEYSVVDSVLSGKFNNQVNTQRFGVGYRFNIPGINFVTELSYQNSEHNNKQTFPFTKNINRTFNNLMPSVILNVDFSRDSRLQINYRTSTNTPSASQLIETLDNTNPLQLSVGNSELKQSYSHFVMGRYSITNFQNAQTYFFILSANYAQNYIGNSIYTASKDSFAVGNILLNRGMQLTKPTNLDGFWSVRGFFTFGFPFTFIKSNFNINTGITYSKTPTLINNSKNFSNSISLSQGIVLTSNISEDFDFSINYSGNLGLVKNTIQLNGANNSYYQLASFRIRWNFWEGVVLNGDVSNSMNRGLTSGYNQSYTTFNFAFGKKFLENDKGEVKFAVNNILNQKNNINRTVTDTYIEDSQSQVLGRFAMLNFSYTMR